jgi:hypothetical protein
MTQRHLSKPFIDFDYERNSNFKGIFSPFVDDEGESERERERRNE